MRERATGWKMYAGKGEVWNKILYIKLGFLPEAEGRRNLVSLSLSVQDPETLGTQAKGVFVGCFSPVNPVYTWAFSWE